jgi:hypothetical protein
MTVQEKLIDWCSRRGIRLRMDQAEYLVNLIQDDIKHGWWKVTKYKYTYTKSTAGSYEADYTEYVSPAKGAKALAKGIPHVEGFNLFVIDRPEGVQQIYTIRDDIFRLE